MHRGVKLRRVPDPAVRTINPMPLGTGSRCRIFFRRLRSFESSILREMPFIFVPGIITRKRPGMLMFAVTRPLVPMASFVT